MAKLMLWCSHFKNLSIKDLCNPGIYTSLKLRHLITKPHQLQTASFPLKSLSTSVLMSGGDKSKQRPYLHCEHCQTSLTCLQVTDCVGSGGVIIHGRSDKFPCLNPLETSSFQGNLVNGRNFRCQCIKVKFGRVRGWWQCGWFGWSSQAAAEQWCQRRYWSPGPAPTPPSSSPHHITLIVCILNYCLSLLQLKT